MNSYEYKKLNKYLNELSLYFQKRDIFYIDNIAEINKMSNLFYNKLFPLNLTDDSTINTLTYEDVYSLAFEIIENIAPYYLKDFQNIIKNGILDFGYNNEYNGSYFRHTKNHNEININRVFNYNDVISLIHEFIHYTSGKRINTINRNIISEFLAIYFELVAMKYLVDKGISIQEIDYKKRLRGIFEYTKFYLDVNKPITCFFKCGSASKRNYEFCIENKWISEYGDFDNNCKKLLNSFIKLEKNYKNSVFSFEYNDESLRNNISFGYSYLVKYILGISLTFYALKCCDIKDILNLNSLINYFNEFDIKEVLKKFGIDMNNIDFYDNINISIDEFINNYNIKQR